MSGLTEQPWFWPVLAVVVGLPIALLVLNEIQGVLRRRGSAFAKPVALIRNWLLPALAVYLLLNEFNHDGVKVGDHATWAKIAATVVGFVIMLALLSGANAALFGTATEGSWRSRLPGIFIDLGRCRTRWARSSRVCCCCSNSPSASETGWTPSSARAAWWR
jgi:amino acid transporter